MALSVAPPFQTFLTKLAAHSALRSDEHEAILALPRRAVQICANKDFVRLGERVNHASLIVEGLVGRFGANGNGARQITALHIPGDMADLNSVVAPEASSAMQALSAVTILQVPHTALRALARHYPAIAEAFWRECVLDAAVLAQWVVNVGRRSAQSRMAHLLCELGCRYRAAGMAHHSEFPFLATQSQLADMLGLTSVHVNRTLMSLREEKTVTIKARRACIHDWNRLAQIGDFDPSYLQIGEAVEEPPCTQPRLVVVR